MNSKDKKKSPICEWIEKEYKPMGMIDLSQDIAKSLFELETDMKSKASAGDVSIFNFVEFCNKLSGIRKSMINLNSKISSLAVITSAKNFHKNIFDTLEFKKTIAESYSEKIKEEWVKVVNTAKEQFNTNLLEVYDEKYVILDYYMICYLTEEKSELFNEYIKYLDADHSPKLNEKGEYIEDKFVEPQYWEEMKSLIKGDMFTNFPWILGYSLDRIKAEFGEKEYDRISFGLSLDNGVNDLMDTFYDKAVEEFYKKYPEVKEYAEKHTVDFDGSRHKSEDERAKENFKKLLEEKGINTKNIVDTTENGLKEIKDESDIQNKE